MCYNLLTRYGVTKRLRVLSSLLSPNIYEPDTGITELLYGNENFLPEVPKGLGINTKSWKQEAILRIIINYYQQFITRYFGKLPAYEYESLIDWNNLRKTVKTLVDLESDETAFIFNGSVTSLFKTSYSSPRIILLNSKHELFDQFYDSSYCVYNEMLKNSYTRTGVTDIVDDNYYVFNSMATKEYFGDFEDKLMFTAGFGITGASQALAMQMNKGVSLVVDMDRKLIERMVEDSFCNVMYEDPDSAFDVALDAKRNGLSRTIGLVGNASEILWMMIDKGIIPNLVTDRTNTYDPVNGYFPSGYSYSDALRIRKADPHHYKNLVGHTIMTHVKAMLEMQKRGARVFEYGNKIREKAYNRGFDNAYSIPGYTDEYIYPVISDSEKLNFKWFGLSGDNEDIFVIDDILVSLFKDNKDISRMIDLYNKIILPKNTPSRNVKMDKDSGIAVYKEINEMLKNEELSAPILTNVSHFSAFDNNEKFISEPSDINLNELIDNNKGMTMVSFDYYGNKDQFFKMTSKSLLLDGSKEAEQNIENLVIF